MLPYKIKQREIFEIFIMQSYNRFLAWQRTSTLNIYGISFTHCNCVTLPSEEDFYLVNVSLRFAGFGLNSIEMVEFSLNLNQI